MKVTILGFGGWVSNPLLGQPAYLVEEGNVRILLDCGEGTLEKLVKCTCLDVNSLSFILITHAHGDHLLGLPTLIQRAKHLGKRLNVAAPSPVVESLRELLSALQIPHYMDYVIITELQTGVWVRLNEGIRVKAINAIHPVPSVSYVLRVGSKIVAYSGDTWPNSDFLREAEGADVLIHEVSAPPGMVEEARLYGHTPSEYVPDIIRKVKPRYFIPTHYYVEPPRLMLGEGLHSLSETCVVFPAQCLSVSVG